MKRSIPFVNWLCLLLLGGYLFYAGFKTGRFLGLILLAPFITTLVALAIETKAWLRVVALTTNLLGQVGGLGLLSVSLAHSADPRAVIPLYALFAVLALVPLVNIFCLLPLIFPNQIGSTGRLRAAGCWGIATFLSSFILELQEHWFHNTLEPKYVVVAFLLGYLFGLCAVAGFMFGLTRGTTVPRPIKIFLSAAVPLILSLTLARRAFPAAGGNLFLPLTLILVVALSFIWGWVLSRERANYSLKRTAADELR